MNYIIAADSSANLLRAEWMNYTSVPLKIVAGEKEYVDDEKLDTELMLSELAAYKGRSGTACPSVGEWLNAFGDAENVFAVTITSHLSGCYNACVQAKHIYEQEHPGRRVCCLDSLSAGPEMLLIVEKLKELVEAGLDFDEIESRIRAYMEHSHLVFMLESVDNLARNGRISLLAAKTVGVLGIRIVGKASDEGDLQPLHKCLGESRGLAALLRELIEQGYRGGKLRIAHGHNENGAKQLEALVRERFPEADISTRLFAGLCCFYGERGCLMAGFEDAGSSGI